MKSILYLLTSTLLLINLAHGQHLKEFKLIPYPQEVEDRSDKVFFKAVSLNLKGVDPERLSGIEYSLKRFLPDLEVKTGKTDLQIRSKISKGFRNKEAYRLQVGKNEVFVEASHSKGVFYAIQTLIQLIEEVDGKFVLPHIEIYDYPAFELRGFMHDVGRNFQSIEQLKEQLDFFALYKINVFHWHLTDHPAWRIQSYAYPQLNNPEFQREGRDQGAFYTYDQIRDLIAYAKERNIQVIPEIDVPGHSAYFEKAFGFTMASAEGIKVLETCFTEFFKEIPASSCPYIHLGADEVHISNPIEFMERMEALAQKHERTPIVWDPGLKGSSTIRQVWMDEDVAMEGKKENRKTPYLDSSMGYINSLDPLVLVQRIFLRPVGFSAEGDPMALGGILCCWNDVRVNNKENILRHNAVYPASLAFAERFWRGGSIKDVPSLMFAPPVATDAYCHLKDFERRMTENRKAFFTNEPFPWVPNAAVKWKLSTPFHHGGSFQKSFLPEVKIKETYLTEHGEVTWNEVGGGTIDIDVFNHMKGIPNQEDQTVYALTYIFSDAERKVPFWIGFETPARSNRQWAGVPALGQWDANGGNLWVNDQPVPPPIWNSPQTNRFLKPTWTSAPEEIPYTDEEFYWTRRETKIELTKGWNKVLIRVPKSYAGQGWSFTFVPLSFQGLRFATEMDEVVLKE